MNMKNKKFIFLIFLISSLFLIQLSINSANDISYPIFSLNNQYYSVLFNDKGEATIVAKINIQNLEEEIKNIELEIPGEDVRMLYIVQEYYETKKTCMVWEEVCNNLTDNICHSYVRECKEYGIEKLYPPKYNYLINYKTSESQESIKYTLELSKKISAQEPLTIFLYYKTKDYTKQRDNIFDFDFETIKFNYYTDYTRVGIGVRSGLYLKGAEESSTNYDSDFLAIERAMEQILTHEGSSMLNYYSDRITYIGSYVKDTSSLSPLESFHVKGIYATSWAILNKTSITITIIAILISLWATYFFILKLKKLKTKTNIPTIIGIGFGSAIFIFLLWFGFSILIRKLIPFIAYPYASLLILLSTFIVAIIILILLFGLPVYIGAKYRIKEGILTLVITFLSLFFILIITIVLLKVLGISLTKLIPF